MNYLWTLHHIQDFSCYLLPAHGRRQRNGDGDFILTIRSYSVIRIITLSEKGLLTFP
jgi:hypothetical protein